MHCEHGTILYGNVCLSCQRDFKRQVLGEWELDLREVAIMSKLQQYKDTTENMNNRDALIQWRLFKEWALNSGYSNDEINRAKRNSSNIR